MSDLRLGDIASGSHHRAMRHGCLPALIALALIVAIGIFAYVKGVDLIKSVLSGPEDYSGDGHGSVIIKVDSGATSSAIGNILVGADVVKSTDAFKNAAEADPRSLTIQAGCYSMHSQMSAKNALTLMLKDSSHVNCPGESQLTVPEGLRANEILALVAKDTHLSSHAVKTAFAATNRLGLPSYADGDGEGYLFPATYDVTKTTTAPSLLKTMVAKFAAEADAVKLQSKARALGVSPHDVVIVASLIQAEASRPQDLPKVASVIYNRLDAGMPLQLDSTLHYAVDSRGEIQTSANLRDLNSPYNTYKRTGLPPTAIDSPGATALEAALNPARTSYLYFVTVNLRTGDTRFATTFAQHQANVQLLNQYCETSSAC